MRELVYTIIISNNRPSFHWWLKENLAKRQKLSKYYENDYRFLVIFHIFLSIALGRKQSFSHIIKILLKKHLEKPNSKTFPVGTRSKTSFLTSTTAVDTQQMSKTQSRLVVKPKIIESLSACKIIQSICLVHQIICEMHLIFRVSYDLKGPTHF